MATTDFVRAGTCIFNQGDSAEYAYIIDSGAVEISLPKGEGKKVLAILGPGEVFGEMGPVDGYPRSADAVAILDTSLITVDKNQISRRLDASDPFVVGLFRTISSRLRETYGFKPKDTSEQKLSQEALVAEIKVERLIREGLETKEFEAYFQPIIEMKTLEVLGFECLVRWRQSDGTMIPPIKFIPLAERSGLIRDIDVYMLTRSCELFNKHGGQEKGLYLSVNLSANHFGNPDIVRKIESVLQAFGLTSKHIKFEVTESALIKHPDAAREVLDQLKSRGFIISLDDFGTGYSSLNYLHKYPIDVLKIDKSFVDTMMDDKKGERIVDAMIALAKSLSLTIIAEGVEEQEQADTLMRKGVMRAQGWLFGKPVPAEEAFLLPLNRNEQL